MADIKEPWHLSRGVNLGMMLGLLAQLVVFTVFIIRLEGAIALNADHIGTNVKTIDDIKDSVATIDRELQDRGLTLVRVSVQLEALQASVASLATLTEKIDYRLDEVQRKGGEVSAQ